MGYRLLCINPGSTSTRIAVFNDNEAEFSKNIKHSNEELEAMGKIQDQLNYRYELIKKTVESEGIDMAEIDAFVGRGGALRPMEGGVFSISEQMIDDCKTGKYSDHPSNLGCQLAILFANKHGKPSFVIDPPLIDEFHEVSRISGFAPIKRNSAFHALNEKAVARFIAEKLGKRVEDINMVTAHLGSGISVTAHLKGRCVDNTFGSGGDGPFSPERCGRLPADELLSSMQKFSEIKTAGDWKKEFSKKSGLVSYLGTNDVIAIEEKSIDDAEVKDVLDSMIYAIAKEVAAYCTIINWDADAIGITGAIANSEYIVNELSRHLDFIAPVFIFPGEYEMEALAQGAVRALNGEEKIKVY
ncbi:butyrate kinase [Sedimentibacter hydroxybenzoicus DSM 7310]|uniref:Probable butyrate kinase n=1 Tax=Sedimentibacter hydroxybenzoicus DSM 7310 TaxID=1123245 RepID=A0A974BK00_SEDHY|nr:butyrate kinase [Sedimentibacter hydroxybenzoicus]NYB74684.1 butyrate kinase [Sedimentibacter hydroxybenzoicus DSM 7310]